MVPRIRALFRRFHDQSQYRGYGKSRRSLLLSVTTATSTNNRELCLIVGKWRVEEVPETNANAHLEETKLEEKVHVITLLARGNWLNLRFIPLARFMRFYLVGCLLARLWIGIVLLEIKIIFRRKRSCEGKSKGFVTGWRTLVSFFIRFHLYMIITIFRRKVMNRIIKCFRVL